MNHALPIIALASIVYLGLVIAIDGKHMEYGDGK